MALTHIFGLRQISILFAIISLSACANIPKHQLSAADVKTYSLQAVAVKIDDTTRVDWGRYKREQTRIAESKPLDGTAHGRTDSIYLLAATNDAGNESEIRTSDSQVSAVAYASNAQELHRDKMLAEPLRVAFKEKMDKIMLGDRPVRAEVTLQRVSIPSAGQTILIGGSSYGVIDFRLVDIGTGSTLALYPKATVLGDTQSGLLGGSIASTLLETAISEGRKRNKYEVISHNMARQMRYWLVPSKVKQVETGQF